MNSSVYPGLGLGLALGMGTPAGTPLSADLGSSRMLEIVESRTPRRNAPDLQAIGSLLRFLFIFLKI